MEEETKMKNYFTNEEMLERLEEMSDVTENEEQAKEEFDILMDEIFALVLDLAKEKLASPGDEIRLSCRLQVIKEKDKMSMSKIVASTE